MNYRHKIVCLALFTFLWSSLPVFAQHQFTNSIHFTTEDGLPDNHVNHIIQDERGFIWMSTHEGLSRFDGSFFKTYRHDHSVPNSLLYNRGEKVVTDEQRIWMGSTAGISALNIATDTFTNFIYNKAGERMDTIPKDVLAIPGVYKDKRGQIWCATRGKGFGRYNRDKDDFDFFQYQGVKHLDLLPNPEMVHQILGIHENLYNDSIIWFGTNQGLLEFNRFTEEIELFYFPQPEKQIEVSWNAFRTLYQHHNGLLYIGNWSPNVLVFDPAKRTLQPLPFQGQAYPFSGVNNICRKSETEIWITSTSGVIAYNINEQKITLELANKTRLNKFYGVNFVDNSNRFWIYSFNGAYCYDPLLQQFNAQSYAHLNAEFWGFARSVISRNKNQELIVCAQSALGMFHLDRRTNEWRVIPVPDKYYSKRSETLNGRQMIENPDGSYTINNVEQLFTFDPISWEIKDFPFQPQLSYNFFRSILWDSQGWFWMGTYQDGLIRWDPKTGQSRNYKQALDKEGSQFVATTIDLLFEDSKKNIWIKRDKGFSLYLSNRDTILNFLGPLQEENTFPSVIGFTEDRHGRIWMSSLQGTVGYADVNQPEKGVIKKINLKAIDPSIRWFSRMRTDLNGDIWVLSTHNLIKINAESLEPTFFSYHYGIEDNEFFSFDFLPSGEMVIGLRGSIVVLSPQDLRKNEELPSPYVTEIEVLDKRLASDTSALLLKKLNLKHWENFFSFDFSAKGFTLPEHIQYRFRLQNFNEDWLDAKDRRFANYTNVPSGDYVFQLQAANNEGMWNDAIYELPVSIATPWWQTWWFRVASFLVLFGLGYSIYRFRIFQIRKEERLKTEFQKQLTNVEMNALRAQMNPHFLFNCLNSIDSYIIKNETKKASEYLNKFARLVRLILQNSRSNYVNLKDELESLDLYMSMECLRFRHKFGYEIMVQEDLEIENIDIPPMLIQPFVENAIWHGLMHIGDNYKGKVKLLIEKENGTLNCVIEDNGIGREKSAEIKKRKNPKGKGKKSMGMRITQDRIEMINKLYGTKTSVSIIDLKDETGHAKGTRVELNIPV